MIRIGRQIVRPAFVGCLVLLLTVSRAAAQPSSYAVGAQDVITISVFSQPDLSGKFSVDADGVFTFPLIGRVKAGGLTLREVEAELRGMLAQGYLKNPQVTVSVDQYRSQRSIRLASRSMMAPLWCCSGHRAVARPHCSR